MPAHRQQIGKGFRAKGPAGALRNRQLQVRRERVRRTMNLRIGRFALTVEYCPCHYGWTIHQWQWHGRKSWRHGSATFGRIKIIW
jgi:hypothetical protein